MFSGLIAQHCSRQVSVYEMMLQWHIFKIVETSNTLECLKACNDEKRCQSFNYVVSKNICEMNNRTKEARPEDFVPDSDRYYYGRVRNRGLLLAGERERPVTTRKDVKASTTSFPRTSVRWITALRKPDLKTSSLTLIGIITEELETEVCY